ncbi:HNH endonuclease [Halogranum rubrum]|uniref:HNH endonuclease n=1 Tax=Halogranum rubrum TaxID=553466 RepID=UPI0036F264CC
MRQRSSEAVTVRDAFRNRILGLYNDQCLLTDLSGGPFVTLSHILPRAEYPQFAEHPQNVTILNWLHHRAFDANLFTLDSDLRLHVHPEFVTDSEFLRRTLVDRDGEQLTLPEGASLSETFLRLRNEELEWLHVDS